MATMLTRLNVVTPARLRRAVFAEREAQIIGVASGLGAPDARCAEGPVRLLSGALAERLAERGIANTVRTMVHADDARPAFRYRALARLCSRVAGEVAGAMASGALPVVLGGDHSCAVGTWSGVARATSSRGAVGLVWVDAHMDSHTPATSHSRRPHGMPLAALLGFGGRRCLPGEIATLVADPPVSASHSCLVGVRSYEREEAALIGALGVRVYGMKEIEARGMTAVMSEAVERASRAEAGYGVSIDLDAVDPVDAPGVGSPVSGGIPGRTLVESLYRCAADVRLLAVEIVEYNPHRDVGHRTATLIEELLQALLARPRCELGRAVAAR